MPNKYAKGPGLNFAPKRHPSSYARYAPGWGLYFGPAHASASAPYAGYPEPSGQAAQPGYVNPRASHFEVPGRRDDVLTERDKAMFEPDFGAEAVTELLQDRSARREVDASVAPLEGGADGLALQLRKMAQQKMGAAGDVASPYPSPEADVPGTMPPTPGVGSLGPVRGPAPEPTAEPVSAGATPPGLYARWATYPQTPMGDGPQDPIPVPFTMSEILGSVRAVQAFKPHGPIGGIHPAFMFVADKLAETLQRWGRSRGWVTIRPSLGGAPRTFNLGDKVYLMQQGQERFGARATPPAGVVPVNLESARTTWEVNPPDMSQAPAAAPPPVYGPSEDIVGGGEHIPVVQRGALGARSNLYAQMTDAVAMFPGGPMQLTPFPAPAVPAAPEPALRSPLSLFPLLQSHSIKG